MTDNKDSMMRGRALADEAVLHAVAKKAEGLVLLNPGDQSGIAEWFFICHGSNEIHNKAIAEAVLVGLKEKNTPPWHTEGINEGRWILLDYSDVVVSIMLPELREYYALETLWEGCPRIDIQE